MSDEKLQAADQSELDLGNAEPDENQSDTATEAGADQSQKAEKFSEAQQKVFDEAQGRITSKLYESKQEAVTLKQELADVKSQIPQPTQPVIPEFPDVLDEDFEAKKQAYTDAIRAEAQFSERQKTEQDQAVNAQNTALKEQQTAQQSTIDSYFKKANVLGITQQEAASAGKVINDFGIDPYVQQYILEEAGPAVARYLSANVADLQTIAGLSPMSAAAFIAKLVPAANASVQQSPNDAPDPANELKGGGSPPKQRGPEGATFE